MREVDSRCHVECSTVTTWVLPLHDLKSAGKKGKHKLELQITQEQVDLFGVSQSSGSLTLKSLHNLKTDLPELLHMY